MCGPKFCSMKITQEVDRPKDGGGVDPESGMAEMSKRFRDEGGELYVPAAE